MKRFARIPPLQCLVTFEALARLRNGSLAASELSITPSAVSHRIRQLEELLGVSMFTRTQNELNLSSAGLEYLPVVRECLESLSQYPTRGLLDDERTLLRISSPPTFARQIIVPRLPTFQEQHPDIEVVLQLSVPFVGLKADDADVEIRFGSGEYPGLTVETVLDEPVTPICSPAYLEKAGPFLTPSDIAKANLLRCPIEPWRPWFKAADLDLAEPRNGPQYVDLGLLVEAAISGHGLALARRNMIKTWLNAGMLITLFPMTAKGLHAYYATWLSVSPQYAHVENFVKWLKADLETEKAD
jgi:LysR family glycine cleavage system transcriptional activator